MTFPTGHPIRPAAHDPGSQNVHCNLRHTLISTQDSYHSTPKSTEDILHIILKTRKSWKTLKGQAEAVWPPFLEATMLKALQEYVPEDSRETRILGRFPMRNRFISDYIYRATGKYRSAKQVGSRLQQLRDTAEGRELIDSLTRCYHAPSRPQSAADHICSNNAQDSICQPSSPLFAGDPFPFSISTDISASDSCSSSSPSSESLSLISVASLEDNYDYTSPIMSHSPSASEHSQAADARTPVYIDILPDYSRSRWPPSSSTSSSTTSSAAAIVGVNTQYASGSARCMRDIDPFVTFVSPNPVTGKSRYIVVLDGAPVHSETTQLEYVGPYFTSTSTSSPPASMPSRHGGPALYNTALVPRYWDILCRSPGQLPLGLSLPSILTGLLFLLWFIPTSHHVDGCTLLFFAMFSLGRPDIIHNHPRRIPHA
ncbi:hypothetical protein ID866_5247 [Astraeus odoratus]|nr:hypothetical protein ID866_5247 [Astraeus odoratus]